MQAIFVCLLVLPTVLAVPCTDSTPLPTLPTTTTPPPSTPSTEYQPPPTRFPRGSYALPETDDGCPPDSSFKGGWYRYWDTEDYYNANGWTFNERFAGFFKLDGLVMQFCVKKKARGRYDWPAGNYCIVKKGDCPTGFNNGSIYWDDENSHNQNRQTRQVANGPDGEFNSNGTRLDFCCRDDGPAEVAIKLPIEHDFYLLRHTSECQRVAEMDEALHLVRWDDEDNNNMNWKSGSHPYDSGPWSDHLIHFCYYSKRQDLNSTIPY